MKPHLVSSETSTWCGNSQRILGELLHGKLESLDMDDVVTFVRSLSKLDLPSPPSFAHFEHIDMYICPLGASIGSTNYPSGASFSADITIFGIRGDILTSMGSSGFKMDGWIDGFSLGPFSVRGTGGDRPLVDIEFDESKQHVLINGLLKLFDVTTALHLIFDIAPHPDFSINFALKFVDELSFTVNGVLSGPPDFRDLGNIDFNLEAVFQQDLLEHLTREVLISMITFYIFLTMPYQDYPGVRQSKTIRPSRRASCRSKCGEIQTVA